jgi:hypothetical protein
MIPMTLAVEFTRIFRIMWFVPAFWWANRYIRPTRWDDPDEVDDRVHRVDPSSPDANLRTGRPDEPRHAGQKPALVAVAEFDRGE